MSTEEGSPLVVLVHSPLVGPSTWAPVAQRLRARGHDVRVPVFTRVCEGEPPYWPRVVAVVAASLAEVPASRRVVLVGHSNAGLHLPVIIQGVRQQVVSLVFVDARLPPAEGEVVVAEDEFLAFLRNLADDAGVLPPWTQWWGEEDISGLLPDPQTRQVICADQPRLPLAYFTQHIPAPAGWARRPCVYVQFGDGYGREAVQARELGWPVHAMAGEHLHQVVDPDAVTDVLVASIAG